MKRRLLNLLTALSLLLFLAVVALWVRSYWVQDELTMIKVTPLTEDRNGTPAYQQMERSGLWSGDGVIGFSRIAHLAGSVHGFYQRPATAPRTTTTFEWRRLSDTSQPTTTAPTTAPAVQSIWSRAGFSLVNVRYPSQSTLGGTSVIKPPTSLLQLRVPAWLAVVVTAALPAWRGLLSVRRRRRFNSNLCMRCGYDLQATPDRCPECGTPASGARA